MNRFRMETIRIIFFVASLAIIIWRVCNILRSPKIKTSDVLQEQLSNDGNKRRKEELQFTLESVNSWLNNCDQKAGMLLAVIGVAITILFASDFVKFIREYIFTPFVKFCEGREEYLFSWGRFTVLFLLIVAAAFLIISCRYLFKAIGANINYRKMYDENPGLVMKSYIFFGTISGMKYEDFKKGEVDFEEDLKSQIYVNSKIATTKFQNYNKGLSWFKLLILVIGMLFVAVMIIL